MSTTTTTKKRKSVDGTANVTKKVKIARSADKPAPLKSALKKSKTSTITAATPPSANGVAKKTSKKNKKEVVEDPPAEANEDDGPDAEELTPDQTAALLAGFSSDSESEDQNEEGEEGVALSSIPKPPTPKAKSTTSGADTDPDPESTPAVLYIGRIPHGFHEPQMRAYFSQFGHITHLRLARNPKTGKSQHYAFVEFASSAVADIVRRTMDKYLLFGRILQVRAVPREQCKENMFAGASRRARRKRPGNRIEGRLLSKGMGREGWEKRVEREKERRAEKERQLRELGYDFDMPAVKGVEDVPVKGTAEAVEDGEREGEEVKVLTGAVDGEGVEEGGVVAAEEVVKKRTANGKKETKEKKVKKVKA